MRVLILSALLACVSAAPSHLVPIGLAALPIVVPAVPSGDIQAAVIDAQVKINDQAQELADQARARAELAVENQNEGVVEANDLVKEKSEEAFWAAEEKKWQALNEAQIAAAKLDASMSSNIAAYKQAHIGSPIIAPVVPAVVNEAASSEAKADVKSEVVSEVKSAESEVKSEAISEVKSEDKESVEHRCLCQSGLLAALPITTPTVTAGDLQAAAINAQVKLNDLRQEMADLARARAEEIMEIQNEKAREENQAFWDAEEKKWQALYEAQLVAARVDVPVSVFPVSDGDDGADFDKTVDKSQDELEVKRESISETKNESEQKVKSVNSDVTKNEDVKSIEDAKGNGISKLENAKQSLEENRTQAMDELVQLFDEIQKSVDLANILLAKASERQNQLNLEADERARQNAENASFAAEMKKWQSLNEAQIATAKLDSSHHNIADN